MSNPAAPLSLDGLSISSPPQQPDHPLLQDKYQQSQLHQNTQLAQPSTAPAVCQQPPQLAHNSPPPLPNMPNQEPNIAQPSAAPQTPSPSTQDTALTAAHPIPAPTQQQVAPSNPSATTGVVPTQGVVPPAPAAFARGQGDTPLAYHNQQQQQQRQVGARGPVVAGHPANSHPGVTPPVVAGRMTGGPPGMAGRAPMTAGRPAIQGPIGMRAGGVGTAPMQTRLPPSLQAKMDKLASQRGASPATPNGGFGGPSPQATSMGALLRQQALRSSQPPQPGAGNAPNAGPLGLAARRAGPGGRPMTLGSAGPQIRGGIAGRRGPPGGLTLGQMGGPKETVESKFNDFNKIMDPSGSLKFSKAVLHSGGVDFGDGQSFKINMDEMDVLGELGKGNYGSVQKVFHRPTGVMMAMKEIRLELDESKLNGIIMELDILHRAAAAQIVEFYGAFTIESCVYYCMEFMDAGSLDKLTSMGVDAISSAAAASAVGDSVEPNLPEPVMRRITASIVRGLGFLKDELQIMHRDVKPTNVLMNRKGEVKLCDFGVSGQLEKSLAKTNIGCQSYMAPERIKGESQNQVSTYTVSSDVWSVGLTVIEIAKGCYPYPPETFANVFAQLTAIVNGPAPTLPKGYSADANDFVAKCLMKDPNARPTYAQLMQHPFLLADKDSDVDMAAWVKTAMARAASRGVIPLAEVEA